MAWVSWEACRLIGGGGVALSAIINNREYQAAVGRRVLIGAMYMPCDCVEYTPDEDVEDPAFKLNSRILYRTYPDGYDSTLSPDTVHKFREVEARHGIIELTYLRDNRTDEHLVERLLVNLSAVLLPL
jgi:hypothetical protein